LDYLTHATAWIDARDLRVKQPKNHPRYESKVAVKARLRQMNAIIRGKRASDSPTFLRVQERRLLSRREKVLIFLRRIGDARTFCRTTTPTTEEDGKMLLADCRLP